VKRLAIGLYLALFSLATIHPAQAGMIVLAGDSNIINALDGSLGGPIDSGNQQFFQNVLGPGNTALIQGDGFGAGQAGILNTFYNGLGGVTSSILPGATPISAANLTGVSLFVGILPGDPYSAGEVAALSAFLAGGGHVMLIGEHASFSPTENARINALLVALGSGLSLQNAIIDPGFTSASLIAVDPLTLGVNTFTLAASSQANGGVPLIFGSLNRPIIARDGLPTVAAVPEPASLALWSIVGVAFGLRAFRNRRRNLAA
jgi:hypothetical protein